MNSPVRPSLLFVLALSGLNAAELPKKAPLSRYADLWTKSPFTAPPKVGDTGPVVNPFDDLALKGIAPIAGGYLITLLNRKNPAEAVPPIDTDQPSEYKVLRIEHDPDKALGTVVYLQKGEITGSVTFDEKLSVPKPPVAKAGPKHPGPPQAQPAVPQVPAAVPAAAPVSRQPRSRVVPPPTGTQPGGQSGGQSGGRSGGGRFSGDGSTGGGYQRPSGR